MVYYRSASNENLPRPQSMASLANIKVEADLLYGQGFRRPLDVYGNEQQSSPDGQSPENCECIEFEEDEEKEFWSHEHHRTISKCSSIELRSVFDTTEQLERSDEPLNLFGSAKEIPLLLDPTSQQTPFARSRTLSCQEGQHTEFASSERLVSTDTHLVDELHHLLDITQPLPSTLLPDYIQLPELLLTTSPLPMESMTASSSATNGFCASFGADALLSQSIEHNSNDSNDLGDLIQFG